MKRFFVLAALLLAGFAAPLQAAPLKVVASFSILADIVKQVGGDKVEVATLVGPDSDAHVFEPQPSHAKALTVADLIVANGLGFEGWMDRLIKQSGTHAKLVVASEGIAPLKAGDDEDEHEHEHESGGHTHGMTDPHAWQSVPNIMHYVTAVRDALSAADKGNQDYYSDRAERYMGELRTLDAYIRAQLGQIPPEQRKIITNHDAFAYFAKEYGLTILAAHGVQTETEPSAARIAALADSMKAQGVRAVFIENISNARLMQKLQKAAPDSVFGGKLYSDALSAAAPADTYQGMMRWNVTAIIEALKGRSSAADNRIFDLSDHFDLLPDLA